MHAAGHRLYLVGGLVRDRLLGDDRTPDHDLTTDATPDLIRELVAGVADAVWIQGERFGTVGLRVGDVTMEITTHRAEAYVSDSRKPVVRFSTELAEDLARRDFTVNAMAVDVADGTLHDPFGGRVDLVDRILRTPLDPVESFSDDPLRMLRAARFLSRYGLTPAEGLVEAARSLVDRMDIVSSERIRDELFRLLQVENPTAGFALLDDMGVLLVVLPEVAALAPTDRRAVEGRVAKAPADAVLRLAVLVHGAGGHDTLRSWASTLRLSGRDVGRIGTLLDGVDLLDGSPPDEMASGGPPSDERVRRLAARAGDGLDEVVAMAALVGVGPGGPMVGDAVARLRDEGELDDLGPALDGATVMRLLGLEAGPAVGEVMTWLGELRISEGRLDGDEVRQRLLERWETDAG
jgi:poly(A) polymerase